MKRLWQILRSVKDTPAKIHPFLLIPVLLVLFIICGTTASFGGQDTIKYNHLEAGSAPKQIAPLPFLSVRDNRIVNQEGKTIKLRGFQYDCFYVLSKDIHDEIKLAHEDPDRCNIELSKYYFTDKDIIEIAQLSANVVRIGLRLWHIEKAAYQYSETSLRHLDDVIARFGEQGIYVFLDLHAAGQNSLLHNREYGNRLWYDQGLQDRVVSLWKVIASRYKDSPIVAGYDLINEPEAPTKALLHSFYQKCIVEIRKSDKNHIIILEKNLGPISGIGFGGEYDDANLVLSLHFYKPGQFTNQGLMGKPVGLKYPGKYGGIYWDKNRIRKYFTHVLKSLNTRQRPFFVGEFAANVRKSGQYAIDWLTDVMGIMNDKGIHYTFFSYKFPLRNSRAYYVPRKHVMQQIHAITRKKFRCSHLRENQKQLLLSENFELMPALRNVLEKGFKGSL
jgi:hypothetical protein